MSVEDLRKEGPALFDSLPYYDNDLERDPSLKEKAERLIAREMQPQKELHPRVPPPRELFVVRLAVLFNALFLNIMATVCVEEPTAASRARTCGSTSATTTIRQLPLPATWTHREPCKRRGLASRCQKCSCTVGAPKTQVRLRDPCLSHTRELYLLIPTDKQTSLYFKIAAQMRAL